MVVCSNQIVFLFDDAIPTDIDCSQQLNCIEMEKYLCMWTAASSARIQGHFKNNITDVIKNKSHKNIHAERERDAHKITWWNRLEHRTHAHGF